MANEYDLDGLRSSVSGYVEEIKDKLLGSFDIHFLQYVNSSIDVSHALGGPEGPIEIIINSFGDVETLLQDRIDAIEAYVPPTRPPEIDDPIERDTEQVYESEQLEVLSGLFEDIYSQTIGNTGFDFKYKTEGKIEAITMAGFSQKYDLDEDTLERDVHSVANKWAADGYESAPGALSFDIARLMDAFDDVRQSHYNAPTTMLANVIQDNIHTAFNNRLSIEKLHMEFVEHYTAFKYKKIDAIIKAYLAEIEKIKLEMSTIAIDIKSILKAASTDNAMNISEASLKLDQALSYLKNTVTARAIKNGAETDRLDEQIKLITQTADGYTGLFSSLGTMFTGVNIQEQSVEEETP